MRCRVFVPTLVLMALSLSACLALFQQPAQARKKYALLIGANKYDKPGFDALSYAEDDVTELARILQDAGYEVKVLLGSKGGDDRATHKNILGALEEWLDRAKEPDLILVALSGHGQKIDRKDYFCPVDAVPNEPGRMVSLETVLEKMARHAGKRMLFVDACRNISDPTRDFVGDTVNLKDNTGILLSCRSRQRAHESVKVKHGAFFHLVLEGLRGNLPTAKNDKGEITWGDLSKAVEIEFKKQFKELVPNPTGEQQPKKITSLDDDTVLIAPRPNNDKEIVLDLSSKVQLKLVRIPAAGKSFWMGSPKEEKDRSEDEEQHQVEFARDYWLATTETTQEQYQAITDDTPSEHRKGGKYEKDVADIDTNKFPVENVSWDMAKACCDKLTEQQGTALAKKLGVRELMFRLPTEAEWEYACRGGVSLKDSLPFHFKNGPIASLSSRQANFDGNYPYGDAAKDVDLNRTCRVSSYEPNRFGLYDMHGNVWEWCQDYYGPYSKLKPKDPFQDKQQDIDARVLRGGSWFGYAKGCRAACRGRNAPGRRLNGYGFRVCFRLD